MKIIGEKVLVKPDLHKEKTESGIYLPQELLETKTCGTIVAVGNKSELSVGQHVMFYCPSGVEIGFRGDKMLIMSQNECFCVDGNPYSGHG